MYLCKGRVRRRKKAHSSLWHIDGMSHHWKQEMALRRAGQLCWLLRPVINTCTWCPHRHWAPFTPPEHRGVTSLTLPQCYQPVPWARPALSYRVQMECVNLSKKLLKLYSHENSLVAELGLPWASLLAEGTTGTAGIEKNRRAKTCSGDHCQWGDVFEEQLRPEQVNTIAFVLTCSVSPYPCFETQGTIWTSLTVLFLLATLWKMLEALLA